MNSLATIDAALAQPIPFEWTDNLVTRAVALWNSNYSAAVIVSMMGLPCSATVVRNKIKMLCPPRPNAYYHSIWTADAELLLTNLWRDGVPCPEIAAALNRGTESGKDFTKMSVIGKARRLNLGGHPLMNAPNETAGGELARRGMKRLLLPRLAPLRTRHRPVEVAKAVARPERGNVSSVPALPQRNHAPVIDMRCVGLVDLEHNECRWVAGREEDAAFYCGLKQRGGSSYCAGHHAIVYLPKGMKQERGE